jgi:multiple sugar transport system permease protein
MFQIVHSEQPPGVRLRPVTHLRSAEFRHAAFGYALLAPAICVILGLNLYPTLSGIFTSFTDQSLLNPNAWHAIGWQNYQRLLTDPAFRISFVHSLVLTFSAVILQVVLGLGMAHLLIRKVPGIHWFRSIAMVTWVLPIITAVVIFRFLTLPNIGLINIVLAGLGLRSFTRNWFGDPAFAFLLVLVMHLWRNVPFYGIAFMAAMQAIPQDLYEADYFEVFAINNVFIFLANSVVIATSVMLLVVIFGSLGAYALSRFTLRGKSLLMMSTLLPQFFPYVLILIPFYVLMSNLGLVDTHIGLILTHTSITLPFAIWMLTGYFNAIPKELDQAALIDGCSRLGVLFRIIYPTALPGLVVAGFFAFVVSWGDYLFVSILSQSETTQTLPIALQSFMNSLQVKWGMITAGTVVAIVPTILFFSLVQRRLVAGLTAGAVKN